MTGMMASLEEKTLKQTNKNKNNETHKSQQLPFSQMGKIFIHKE